jgi:hypothetical protein
VLKAAGALLLFCCLAVDLAPPCSAEPSSSAEILIEAEEFKVDRGPWRVIDLSEAYYAATLSNTFISRQHLLAAPAQTSEEARASYRTLIPTAGRYRIWSRYECPSRWSVEHTLRIEQRGRVVFERKYGLTSSPKLWPMREGIKPMAELSWGSGDNVVWEPSPETVLLQAGPARFTLTAGPQTERPMPRGGAAERHVDCLLLTTDAEFGMTHADQQTWHVLDRTLNQNGQAFLRVRNPAGGARPFAVDIKVLTHNPYWRPRGPLPPAIFRNGGHPAGGDDELIGPGESSPWVPIGQALDTTNMQELVVAERLAKGQAGLPMTVELARDPRGRRVLRRVELDDPSETRVMLEVPPDLRGRPVVRTVEEWHEDLLHYLRGLPAPRGAPPREIPVLGIMGPDGPPWGERPPRLQRLRAETGLLLGRNTWRRGVLPVDLEGQVSFRQNLVRDVRSIPTTALRARLEALETSGELDQVSMISLGDEIRVGGFDVGAAADQQAFRRYLADQGVASQVVEPLTKDPLRRRAYYWSQRFAIDRSIDEMAERTHIVEEVMGPGVHTGANYTPHPDYYPVAGPWVRMFRRHGMTMPWSEDWLFQVPEASPLVTGYLCDVMRAAARPDDLPIQMYTMPHSPGQTPRDFTLSVYSSLAHGNRILNFFAALPLYEYTENWIAWEARESWRAVRDVVFDVGQADDLLARGRVRPAETAMVISDADDVWEGARRSSIYNFERKSLYHLLRHGQVPVDFVSDDDLVDEASLARYKVIFLSARHLARAAATGLKRWVAQGGWLIGVAGAGTLDEYDEPLGVLDEVFGIRRSEVTVTEKRCWAKEGLAWLPALGEIPAEGGSVPVLAAFDKLTPAAAEVRLRTTEGAPALLSSGFGEGRAIRFAFFPGAAYLQPAFPRRPFHRGTTDESFNHFLPTRFNHAVARLVLSELRAAKVDIPVAARRDGSSDLTVALDSPPPPLDVGVIDSSEGSAVVLANYTGERIDHLTVTLRTQEQFGRVLAARAGPLVPEQGPGTVSVTLPLGWGDIITFRR